jgi:hypothetical protein
MAKRKPKLTKKQRRQQARAIERRTQLDSRIQEGKEALDDAFGQFRHVNMVVPETGRDRVLIFMEKRDDGKIVVGLGGTGRIELALSALSRDEAVNVIKLVYAAAEKEGTLKKIEEAKVDATGQFQPGAGALHYSVPSSYLPGAVAKVQPAALEAKLLEREFLKAKANGLVEETPDGFTLTEKGQSEFDSIHPSVRLAVVLADQMERNKDIVRIRIGPGEDNDGKVDFQTPPDISALIPSWDQKTVGDILLRALGDARRAGDLIDPEYQDVATVAPSRDGERVLKHASFPAQYMRAVIRKHVHKEISTQSPALALAMGVDQGALVDWLADQDGKQLAQSLAESKKAKPRTLDNYLFTLERLRVHATESADALEQQQASLLWAEASHARLIEIKPELYANLYHEADVFTTERLAGQTWKPYDRNDRGKVDADMILRRITDVGRVMPFPEKLPFPAVFLSFRNELRLSNMQVHARVPPRFRNKIPAEATGRILGYLLTEGPLAVEFYVVDDVRPGESVFLYEALYVHRNFPGVDAEDAHSWVNSFMLYPWVLNIIVDLINDHKTLVIEHPDSLFRKKWKKNRKAFSIKRRIPPPYYSVILRDKVIKDMLDGMHKKHPEGMHFSYGHRFDVRRHERVRIMRGPLPLPDKTRKQLQKEPKRRIYTVEPMSAEDTERLARRGVPAKRKDEWLAILVSEIQPHVKPHDDSLPYIPATRKLPDRKDKSVQ